MARAHRRRGIVAVPAVVVDDASADQHVDGSGRCVVRPFGEKADPAVVNDEVHEFRMGRVVRNHVGQGQSGVGRGTGLIQGRDLEVPEFGVLRLPRDIEGHAGRAESRVGARALQDRVQAISGLFAKHDRLRRSPGAHRNIELAVIVGTDIISSAKPDGVAGQHGVAIGPAAQRRLQIPGSLESSRGRGGAGRRRIMRRRNTDRTITRLIGAGRDIGCNTASQNEGG